MNARRCRTVLLATLALLGTIATSSTSSVKLDADSALTMKIAPYLSFAPADLRVQLAVTPRADNRWLFVSAESEDFYRSSEIALAAEEAPRTMLVEFRGLPGGLYDVQSEVRNVEGRTLAMVHQEVTVLSTAGKR